MNIQFFTVIIANSEAAKLDDFKMAKKISCICDENNVPILNEMTGYPTFVQEVREFKGKITHRRLPLENGIIVLETMKQANVTGKAAAERGVSMPVALEIWKKEQEEAKKKETKSVLAAAPSTDNLDEISNNLDEIYNILKSIKCAHHKVLENPVTLKAKVKQTLTVTKDKETAERLRGLNFNTEAFCEAWAKRKAESKQAVEAKEETVEDIFAGF